MMNALEKAKLIKELQDLGQDLDHRALSLYEVARSKKRVRDIFELCNEPIFKKQNLAFKTLTQPDVAAYEFAADSLYKLSFRGFFLDEYDLEKALYQNPESGWAFLYHPKKGWQIWLIPAPNRTALISEWTDIEQSYAWLLHEQELSTCLKTDLELKASAAVLSLADAEIQLKPATQLESHTKTTEIELSQPTQASIALSTEIKTSKIKIPKSKAIETESDKVTDDSIETIEEVIQPTVTKLKPNEDFKLGEWAVEVVEVKNSEQLDEALYELKLQEHSNTAAYLHIILNYAEDIDALNQPIFIAEQLHSSGQFKSYLVLMGATSAEQAQTLIQHVNQTENTYTASMKSTTWDNLQSHILQIEQLYLHYSELTDILLQQESYSPFIPAETFSPRKYMLFDEVIPDTKTPILLLEERQKLRVIHGEKRLKMHANELAYPCIILNRDKKLSWQAIHSLIAEMPKPIAVHELYLALQSQMTE